MGGNVRVGMEDFALDRPGPARRNQRPAGDEGAPNSRRPRPRDRHPRRGARDPVAQGRRQGEFLAVCFVDEAVFLRHPRRSLRRASLEGWTAPMARHRAVAPSGSPTSSARRRDEIERMRRLWLRPRPGMTAAEICGLCTLAPRAVVLFILPNAASHAADRHHRRRAGPRLRARRARAPAQGLAAGRLSARRRAASGPFTPGFVADQPLADRARRDRRHPADVRRRPAFLAEGPAVGPRDRHPRRASARSRWRRCSAWRWPVPSAGRSAAGLVFGLALSVASTVVLLRALQERRLVETERGRIAVGWLIVEDLAMVLTLVLLPALAGAPQGGRQGAACAALARAARASRSARSRPSSRSCWSSAGASSPGSCTTSPHTGSRELFRLAVLAIALGVAFGAARAVRRLVRARRVLRRHGPGRVASSASAPRRKRCRCATPSRCCSSSRSACCSIRRSWSRSRWPVLATVGDHRRRQVGRGLRRSCAPSAIRTSDGADDLGEPRADRRILVHPGGSRRHASALLPEQGRDLILAGAIISIMLNPLLFVLLDRVLARPDAAKPGPAPAAADGRSARAGAGRRR